MVFIELAKVFSRVWGAGSRVKRGICSLMLEILLQFALA
jgi:hypothetical protein